MAKDITIRVTGQNSDGTLNVQQVDGGNPFMSSAQSTSMVPYNPNQGVVPAQQGGYRAKINNVEPSLEDPPGCHRGQTSAHRLRTSRRWRWCARAGRNQPEA